LRKVGEGSGGAVVQTLATLGQTVNAVAMVASGLSQNIIAEALEGDMVPDHTALAPISVSTPGAIDSLFMVSGYKALRHDGFDISSSFAPADGGKTPGFDEQNYGLTVAGRFDGSDILGAAPHSVTLGVLGNYTHTDIDVDGVGGGKGGSADIDSWSVGAYGLVTDGGKYGLVTVVGTFGSPQTSNFVIPAEAEFNNFGFATSAVAGVLVPMGGATKLDLRGGFNYVYGESEDYRDSAGILFSDGRLEEFSGTVSARLFSVMHFDSYNIRPFVQTGLTHRFSYENELTIDGEDFSFDDADTSVFARAGFDFDIGRTTQAYLAVRGDASEDFEAIAAQVGVTFRLD
jgi:outer membrane autotransporter protein